MSRDAGRSTVTYMDKSAHFAEVDAVREYASTLSQQQLQCRDFGHNWRPHTAERRADGGYDRSLICRCRTRRVQVLDQWGRVVSSQYAYPDGYEMPRGIGRISADDKGVLRLASIEHTLQADTHKTTGQAAPKKTAKRAPTRKTAAGRAPAKSTDAKAVKKAPAKSAAVKAVKKTTAKSTAAKAAKRTTAGRKAAG